MDPRSSFAGRRASPGISAADASAGAAGPAARPGASESTSAAGAPGRAFFPRGPGHALLVGDVFDWGRRWSFRRRLGIPYGKRVLDSGERCFGRVLDLLG